MGHRHKGREPVRPGRPPVITACKCHHFFSIFLPNAVGVVLLQLVFRRLSAAHTHICGVQLGEGWGEVWEAGDGVHWFIHL